MCIDKAEEFSVNVSGNIFTKGWVKQNDVTFTLALVSFKALINIMFTGSTRFKGFVRYMQSWYMNFVARLVNTHLERLRRTIACDPQIGEFTIIKKT